MDKGLLFILSAPAGTGKTTIAQMLCEKFPRIVKSISNTTREPRADEKDGVDYYFTSREEFEQKVNNGEFLEHATVFDDYYGTSKERVIEELEKKKHVLLVIDTQGALQVKEKMDAILIFLCPPSIEELRERMIHRQTETKESIEKRLHAAEKELSMKKYYDYQIINRDLDVAFHAMQSIVIAEEHRIRFPKKEKTT